MLLCCWAWGGAQLNKMSLPLWSLPGIFPKSLLSFSCYSYRTLILPLFWLFCRMCHLFYILSSSRAEHSSSVQFNHSVMSDSLRPHESQHAQASLSITNSQRLPKLMSIESVMPSNHLILCCPLLLLPSIFPSIRVVSNESTLHMRWPKYWSFSFSISPSNGHPGLISFRMD